MGYTTIFEGSVRIDPPLSADEITYLKKFEGSRRMLSTLGPYYVDRPGFMGQDRTPDIIDYNEPAEGQPALWCKWTPGDDGTSIVWNEDEKFYHADDWMKYLIDHFIGPTPIAAEHLPFFTGHNVNGEILAQGEDIKDRWRLIVTDNEVEVVDAG